MYLSYKDTQQDDLDKLQMRVGQEFDPDADLEVRHQQYGGG